jgi:hypothetical protein
VPQLANLVTKHVRIAEFERPNDLPGWRLLTVENPNGKLVVRNGCVKSLDQHAQSELRAVYRLSPLVESLLSKRFLEI